MLKCDNLDNELGEPDENPNLDDEPPGINPVFNLVLNLDIDFGFDLGVDFGIGLGNGANLVTIFDNDLGIDDNLSTDHGNDLDIEIVFGIDVDYGVGTGFGNEENLVNLGNGSLFWNKFASSRDWYKDIPDMLYEGTVLLLNSGLQNYFRV